MELERSPSARATRTSAEVMDLHGALRYADGSLDLLRGMASVFLTEMPLRMDDMDEAARAMDLKELAAQAHPVRSMCEAVGGYRCRDTAAALERAALKGDVHSIPHCIRTLKREMDLLSENLFRI